MNFADRVLLETSKHGPVVVALDPVYDRLPDAIKQYHSYNESLACRHFASRILGILWEEKIPIVKINSAFFERYGSEGYANYLALIEDASQLGLIVIGDVKRGDVSHSAKMYAEGHFGVGTEVRGPDAITVDGYTASLQPFVEVAAKHDRGIFVLVRTSNNAAIQDKELLDRRLVSEAMAAEVDYWSSHRDTIGDSGYSSIGAVVGTKFSGEAAKLRKLMPTSILLVPGYGTQGGTAEDYRPYFQGGKGALIVAGRSVIYNFEDKDGDWDLHIRDACQEFKSDISQLTV